jgi:isopentenyl-diphosphate delta-isomerase
LRQDLILVDEFDNELGFLEKLEAHKKGLLHRAVSVFIFNDEGKLLLQKRALQKYHSPGLWANTACSHPLPGETTLQAATRRLAEEMGLVCELSYAFNFTYRAEFKNGLIEHEFDHVFVGHSNENPKPNSNEVMEWGWYTDKEINLLLKSYPAIFTEWFKICYNTVLNYKTEIDNLYL